METRFVIIVVHRNGEQIIESCLQNLEQSISNNDEVVVIDNGSSDASCERIRKKFPQVELIENGCNNGFAAANNQALRKKTARYFLLLNNDASIMSMALNRFSEIFESNPDIAVIAPQLVSSDCQKQRSYGEFMRPQDEIFPRFMRKKNIPDFSSEVVDVDAVIGACMAVRSAATDEVGLLDEDFFFYFEETEWCYRFKKNGYRVVLDQSIQVIHEKGESTRAFRKEAQIEMLRSRLIYYRKIFRGDIAAMLVLYRSFRLFFNFLFSTVLLLSVLGLNKNVCLKFQRYGMQLVWLLLGRPESWGLPGKCHSKTVKK